MLGTAAGTFNNKNVGTGKAVTVSGLSISGADAANYSLTQPTLSADITAATLTITGVTASNKTYNRSTVATLNTGSAALSGVYGGDTVTLDSTAATGSFADWDVGVGKTVTTAGFTKGGGDAGNYTLTQPTTTADITAASLTITADNQSRSYGSSNPSLTASYTGLVSGDTSSVVSGLSLSTAAIASSNVGGYAITASGGTAGNYTITHANGTLTVTAASLTVSPDSYTITYGATEPSYSGSITGAVLGDLLTATYSPAGYAGSTGSYTINAVMSGANLANYSVTYNTGTLTVGQKSLLVYANNQTRTLLQRNPVFSLRFVGLEEGDSFTGYSTGTTATDMSMPGDYLITITGGTAPNYTITRVDGILAVTMPAIVEHLPLQVTRFLNETDLPPVILSTETLSNPTLDILSEGNPSANDNAPTPRNPHSVSTPSFCTLNSTELATCNNPAMTIWM